MVLCLTTWLINGLAKKNLGRTQAHIQFLAFFLDFERQLFLEIKIFDNLLSLFFNENNLFWAKASSINWVQEFGEILR